MEVNATYFYLVVIREIQDFIIHKRNWSRCDVDFPAIIHYSRSEDYHRDNSFAFSFFILPDRFIHETFSDLIELVFERIGAVALVQFSGIFNFREAYKQIVRQ